MHRYINLDFHLDLVLYKANVNQLKSVHLKLRIIFGIPKFILEHGPNFWNPCIVCPKVKECKHVSNRCSLMLEATQR